MKKAVKVGFFDAIISSICYGLYPLFAILLYNTGSSVANSLFYRYAIAFLIYLYILIIRSERRLNFKYLLIFCIMRKVVIEKIGGDYGRRT